MVPADALRVWTGFWYNTAVSNKRKRWVIAQFTRVNFKIRVPQVRVLDAQGQMLGVMATRDAQRLADSRGLDLVEITPNAVPPVCKIMDYGKFRYEESIRAKQMRRSQKSYQVKEIKFHPGTDVGDLEHKLRQVRAFLADGSRVRLSLQFRGRENAHRDVGEDKIAQVLEMLEGECHVEQAPKTDGRIHFCLIGPPRRSAVRPAPAAAGGSAAPAGGIRISVN